MTRPARDYNNRRILVIRILDISVESDQLLSVYDAKGQRETIAVSLKNVDDLVMRKVTVPQPVV